MKQDTMTAHPHVTVADICVRSQLSPAARALIASGQTPAVYFNVLIDKKLYRDAIRFVAHLMTPHQAVAWGCLCVWQALRPQPAPVQAAALHAAVQWLLNPDEQRRRAAETAGRAATVATPAGALALAAFNTGPSLSRPDLPIVAPPPGLSAQTVAAAVLLAVASGPVQQLEHRQRQALSLAIEVSQKWEAWLKAHKA